eukprot:325128-Rhodomonas_salina.1
MQPQVSGTSSHRWAARCPNVGAVAMQDLGSQCVVSGSHTSSLCAFTLLTRVLHWQAVVLFDMRAVPLLGETFSELSLAVAKPRPNLDGLVPSGPVTRVVTWFNMTGLGQDEGSGGRDGAVGKEPVREGRKGRGMR